MKIWQVCTVDFTLKRSIIPLIDAELAQGDTVKSVCSLGGHVDDLEGHGYEIDTPPTVGQE